MAQQNKSKTSEENKKWLWNNIKLFLPILCLIVILWKPLNSVINTVLVSPILQHVSDNCWIVMIALVLLEGLYYWVVCKKVSSRSSNLKRIIIAIEIILLYLLFRLSDEYSFYGLGETFPAYTDVVFIIVTIAEIVLFYKNNKQAAGKNDVDIRYSKFLFDKPTDKDDLKRRGYAITLVEKIKSTFPVLPLKERKKETNTSFTVLLSERYGQGKSSFFEQIKSICESQKIDVIVFRPWLSNNPDHLIINYFDLLKEKLGNYNKELRKLLQSYSVLASEHITGKIAKETRELLNEGSIEKQHDQISRILLDESKLRIVLIDDVDRLQAEELLALIKLVRNTADFPYIAYVIAADKAAMKETLKSEGVADPEEYLKKFFNFELLFPADDGNIIDSLVSNISVILGGFGYKETDVESLKNDIRKNPDYYAPVFSNMRDVYRFCNILSFELDVLRNQDDGLSLMNDICIDDFVKVCLIQYISPDLYKILRDYWYALLKIADNSRLTLKDGYDKYLNSRDDYKRMLQTLDLAKAKLDIDFEGNSQQQKSNEDQTDEEPKSLPEVIDKAYPEKTELIKYLLVELWSDTTENVDLRRIRYISQYFMYFAGRYSKTELSDSEALLLFSLQGADFDRKVSTIVSQKKDALIHKLNIIVDNRSVDRIILLDNIIRLSVIDYQNYTRLKEPLLLSYFEYYRSQQYAPIVQRLYIQQRNEKTEKENLLETHKTFFKTCEQYAAGAFAINAMKPFYSDVDGRYISVFSKEQVDILSKILIDNFFSKVFITDPFGEKTIKDIPCIRVANNKYWDDLFVKYVQKYEDPMEWLFRLFELNESRDGLHWNSEMVLAVLGEYPKQDSFDVVAENLVGKDALNDYKQGMEYINPNHTDFSTKEKVNSKPFTKAAYEWLITRTSKPQQEQKNSVR